jgi:ribosomal protein L9
MCSLFPWQHGISYEKIVKEKILKESSEVEKMKEDICKNQTPFKFLVNLKNSIFGSVSKKVYEVHPNLP